MRKHNVFCNTISDNWLTFFVRFCYFQNRKEYIERNEEMNTIYAGLGYKFWFWRKTHGQYIKHNKIQHVPGGIIAVNNGTYGVFDAQYKFLKSSLKTRGDAHQRIPKFNKDKVKFIDQDVVFLGGVLGHFGHFLLEHFCRAWAVYNMDMRDKSVVLVDYKGIGTVPGFVYKLLGLVGIPKDRIIILNETTRFKNVYLPTQSFDMYKFTSHEYGQIFDNIVAGLNRGSNDVRVFEKLYVSRMKMGDRRTLGEQKIENVFKHNGFHVIYPETLSLEDQAKIVSGCKVLAGCAGTALHLAVFMKQGGTVIQIKRNRRIKDSAITQNLINMTKGLNGVYVSGSVEPIVSSHWSEMPQIVAMTKKLQSWMRAYGLRYNKMDLGVSKTDLCEYNRLLKIYNHSHRKRTLLVKIINKLIKITACFVPGRNNRAKYRNFLKSKMQ